MSKTTHNKSLHSFYDPCLQFFVSLYKKVKQIISMQQELCLNISKQIIKDMTEVAMEILILHKS